MTDRVVIDQNVWVERRDKAGPRAESKICCCQKFRRIYSFKSRNKRKFKINGNKKCVCMCVGFKIYINRTDYLTDVWLGPLKIRHLNDIVFLLDFKKAVNQNVYRLIESVNIKFLLTVMWGVSMIDRKRESEKKRLKTQNCTDIVRYGRCWRLLGFGS